jgi:hypothetical protein
MRWKAVQTEYKVVQQVGGEREKEMKWKDMRKTPSNQRIGTSYLPSQVVQAPTEIIPFRSLYVQCTDLGARTDPFIS